MSDRFTADENAIVPLGSPTGSHDESKEDDRVAKRIHDKIKEEAQWSQEQQE